MTPSRIAVAVLSGVCLPILALACGGGGDSNVDFRDFDTARFTMTQTTTTDGDAAQISGEGTIDNRQQAISVTYSGGVSGQTIAVGPTVYSYDDGAQRWVATTEESDGQVGFGRPYWPQFWRDAVQVQSLGGQTLQGAETTHYLLAFDPEMVEKRLGFTGDNATLEVRQAEVEVWVDNGSRYAVRLTFRLELATGTSSTRIEIVSNFSDFGAEVEIEAPEEAAPEEATPAESGP